MSLSIANRETGDDYSAALTLVLRGATRASVTVNNAAVLAQVMKPGRPDEWDVEEFLIPGVHTYARPLDGVRVRSAVAGVPARVSLTATHGREAGDA